LENNDKKLLLEFRPKSSTSNLFSGYVWIDKSNNAIEKIDYHIYTNDFFYLHPAIEQDKVDSIELNLNYTFDNSNKNNPILTSVSIDYSLLYFSKQLSNTIKITSEGFMLFYDYSYPFLEEIPLGLISEQGNDYQKISLLPYDSIFWAYSGITPQNEKQKQFIDYFQANGFLINFSKVIDSLSGANYIHWNGSSDILYTDLLNRSPVVHVSSGGVSSFNIKNPTLYDIDCQILLNPVKINDSIHITSCTLLNRSTSYYFVGNGYKAAVFINLTFDLFEKKRREIIASYNKFSKAHLATFDDIRSIYNIELAKLKDTIRTFQNETQNGKNTIALIKWYKYMNQKTGIDRSTLIKKMLEEEAISR